MDNDIKLFLIEVLVNSVTFNKAAKFDIGVKSLRVQIQFSDIVKMETTMNIELTENWIGNVINCNCGKSFLFPCNHKALAQSLLRKHLEIRLREDYELIGETKIHWDNRFIDTTRNVGDPVCLMETHPINKYLLKVGEMQVFVRLTCYGDGMESHITHNNSESKAQSLKSSADFIVEDTSFVELYKGDKQLDLEDTQSIAPAEFEKHTHFNERIFALPSKSKSICARSRDNDDFLNVQRLNHSHIMTNERINNLLCNSKDCPAAKKFKEYGLGPLAKTKNLGCADPNMIPSSTYALSHTYGTFDRYGPYGLFRRPKRLDLPFIPRKNVLETIITNGDCTSVVKCNENQVCPRDKPKEGCPLRLTGGGGSSTDLKTPKSPFDVCKDLMMKCDKIVAEYRKALGPCGQTVCPYAPNALGEFCMKTCDFTRQTKQPNEEVNKKDNIPCKNKPACGSPRCAYSKYKTGLVDSDAQMELAFLPPAIVGKCGHPKCEYPFKEEELPPIHWDCPEPLPKGVCKNPDCPYLPADLKALRVLKKSKAPCGSNECPYALPPPCAAPTCPFNRNPCPGLKKKKKCDDLKQNQCKNPGCPYTRKDNGENCPAIKRENGKCDNPECPQEICPKIVDEKENCGDPNCPFMQTDVNHTKKTAYSNPNCPFAEKDDSEAVDNICNNPDCPYKQDTSTSSSSSDDNCIRICPKAILKMIDNDFCQNPECPGYEPDKKPENDDLYRCSNPDCPAFAKKKENKSPCDNPDCPDQESEREKIKSKDICDNPECPYASKESICSNPDCPWAKPPKKDTCKMPNCPLAQSDSFCAFPNCPFNKKKEALEYCTDPNCPFLKSPKKPDDHRNYQQELIKRGSMSQYVLEPPTKNINIETVDNQPEDSPVPTVNGKKKLKRRKRRGKYVYSVGDRYPGMKIGHAACNIPVFRVPPKMGWLWNIHTPCGRLKPRRGWKPGAMTKTIAKRLLAHRQAKGLDVLKLPDFSKKRGGIDYDSDDEKSVHPNPTLQIKKKDGCYYITMHPLKDPNTLAERENPYMECTPLQFKIIKNKPTGNDGDNDGVMCLCDDDDEVKSSSSDSELDIEFTPPAGLIHPERFKKKPNTVHCETQYDNKDVETTKKKGKKDKKEKKKGAKGGKGKKGKGKK